MKIMWGKFGIFSFDFFFFISDGYGKDDSLSIQDQRSDRSNSFHSEVVYALALLLLRKRILKSLSEAFQHQ